jgi:hypothetical protein
MYFKDELQEVPLNTTAQTESVFNVAADTNVNWFGFSVGAGYVLNDRNFGGFWKEDRIRVIVGADLLKLFWQYGGRDLLFRTQTDCIGNEPGEEPTNQLQPMECDGLATAVVSFRFPEVAVFWTQVDTEAHESWQ